MRKKGFTLIELLVVIAIMGIIIAVGTISYITALKQSRDTRRKTDLEQIRSALETYRSENGTYPNSLTLLSPTFMTTVPVDPSTSTDYTYTLSSSYTYSLCATLETVTSPSTCNYTVLNP